MNLGHFIFIFASLYVKLIKPEVAQLVKQSVFSASVINRYRSLIIPFSGEHHFGGRRTLMAAKSRTNRMSLTAYPLPTNRHLLIHTPSALSSPHRTRHPRHHHLTSSMVPVCHPSPHLSDQGSQVRSPCRFSGQTNHV